MCIKNIFSHIYLDLQASSIYSCLSSEFLFQYSVFFLIFTHLIFSLHCSFFCDISSLSSLFSVYYFALIFSLFPFPIISHFPFSSLCFLRYYPFSVFLCILSSLFSHLSSCFPHLSYNNSILYSMVSLFHFLYTFFVSTLHCLLHFCLCFLFSFLRLS